MKRIITFLGDRGAVPTNYEFNGLVYSGGVFAEALRQFCEFDDMLVCVTKKAREKTWPVLEALNDARIKAIDIQTGNTTTEMWATFEVIARYVVEGDHVIFDITHGLRSLPFLVFLFAAYLKSAKNVSIDAVYYGALELQNKETNTPAPVIDMSEFVQMLDWIGAAERFVQTGDGVALAQRIRKVTPGGSALADDHELRNVRAALDKASDNIEHVSLALALARPLEVIQIAGQLPNALQEAEIALADRAKPFRILRQKVSDAYSQFGRVSSDDDVNWRSNLQAQFDLVEWYVDKRQFIQAATLLRELIVSCVLFQYSSTDLLDEKSRRAAENALNNLVEQAKPNPRAKLPTHISLDQANDSLRKFWSAITECRNDIAHVGMRTSYQKAEAIVNDVIKQANALKSLKSTFGL